jgi:hypothetical protein
MNITELKQYVENKKKQRAAQHLEQIAIHGSCAAFTDKEYYRVGVSGKTTYKLKHTHHAHWN